MADITHLYAGGFNAKHYAQSSAHDISPLDRFRDALFNAGLIVETIKPDAHIHRVPTRDDKGKKASGWYVYFDDANIPAGAFGNWKTDHNSTWSSVEYSDLSETQKAWHNQRMQEAKLVRQQEQERIYKEAKTEAEKIWQSGRQCDPDHPYLAKKGVKAYGIRQIEDGRLIVPLIGTDGEMQSLQYINQKGEKLFLAGGKASAGFHIIGPATSTIYIAEGYATAATIFEATKQRTITAFNAGNIKSVAQSIRELNPDARIVIAADDDQFTDGNPGISKATEAAKMINASVVAPKFEDLSNRPTDFNDLMVACGLSEVLKQLGHKEQLSIPMSDIAGREVKEIEWVLDGVLSRGAPAILFANGGAGKSLFIQHLSSCVATGTRFFGRDVMHGPVLSVYCEDDIDEMHRRQSAICNVHKIDYASLNDLHVVSRVGHTNNFLITFDSKNIGEPTDFFHQLDQEMSRIRPVFMTFDTSGDAFPGNENDKAQVNQLLKGIIGTLAEKHNCCILLTGHTPKSGAEFAGHMSWENSVRHRIFIEHDRETGVRNVRLSKTNRGKESDLFTLYWESGCLVEMVDTSFATEQKRQVCKRQTLQLIHEFYKRKTNINLSKFGSYAPKELTELGTKKRINWNLKDYENAIEELLDNEQIELVKGHNRGASQTLKLTNHTDNKDILNTKKRGKNSA